MKKVISFLLMLVMCITLIAPSQVKEAQAAEATVKISTWAMQDLIYGETYGIFPETWFDQGVTGTIKQGKLRVLLAGMRGKLLDSECAVEKRLDQPVIDNSITVEEALKAFYTVLSDYDYTADLGLGLGMDPVAYMKQIGVYTGQNGEQGLKDKCSIEQAMIIATRIITVVYEALGASSKGFLWEVKSGENTVYLLGSIHLASNTIYPFSNKMWQAYNSSNALIVEANLYDQADTAAFRQLAYYTDGTTLKDHVSAETYQKSMEIAVALGIPEASAAYLKPWTLYLTFASYMAASNTKGDAISADLGIDRNFMNNAVIYQKPIYAIEGLTKQAMMLESFSAGLQEYLLSEYGKVVDEMLKGTLPDSEMDTDYMNLMFNYWKDGDVDAFKTFIGSDEEDAFSGELTNEVKAYGEEYQKKFMTQRDDEMAKYINNLLISEGTNTYFVVVGAAHYISDYSVIDRLKKLGYEVNQVK